VRKIFLAIASCFALLISTSFVPSHDENRMVWLYIHMKNYVGNELLKLDSVQYKNALGQPYRISKFKYYISNIKLIEAIGYEFYMENSYLLDQDDEKSLQIIQKDVPRGTYVAIDFILGVDSIHNCSGIQNGDLDPAKGMFWTWNTGYVFLKLEGKAAASKSPGHLIEYHIGGFHSPNNCIRNVRLKFSKPLIVERDDPEMTIKVDVAEILKSPVDIDFSKLSSVTDFHNATMVADNYQDMFSILEIK